MALSKYELEREARIAQNKQRMLELDLPTLFDTFHASMRRKHQVKKPASRRVPKQPSAGPVEKRRSSRLANVDAPDYSEMALQEPVGTWDERASRRPAQSSEQYTEEHVRALGEYKEDWVLWQDGYDEFGNRKYDKAKGQTCHQCRQKTLGLRTSCSCCQALQGVFCGDCLFMRYGENVKEAKANPAWTCPTCRDICNCSIHRIRKGWLPTGCKYSHAISQGYKSVAHWLVLTNLAEPKVQDTAAAAETADEPMTEVVEAALTKNVKEAADDLAAVQQEAQCRPVATRPTRMQQRQITDVLQPQKQLHVREDGRAAAVKKARVSRKGLAENAAPIEPIGLGRMTRSRALA